MIDLYFLVDSGEKMIIKEFGSILRDKRAWIFILLIIIIPLVDLSMVYKKDHVKSRRAHKEEILENDRIMKELEKIEGGHSVSEWIMHPAKASYLTGSSDSHIAQMLLIWLMPIFILNIFSDRYISEHKHGITNAILMRTSKRRYVLNKLFIAFSFSFIVFFIGLFINFCCAQIIFYGGYNFNGLEVWVDEGRWFSLMYTHPNIIYMVYILFTSIIAGICGVICQSIAFLCKNYTMTYIISFFLWEGLVMHKGTIINIVQPFTEYGIHSMKEPAIILAVLFMFFSVVSYIYMVKRDEI